MMLSIVSLAIAAPTAAVALDGPPKYAPVVKSWVTVEGYPAEALRNGWEGVAGFTVTVGTDGKVLDCKIIHSSGHKVLDDATCSEITKRARFTPARDADGRPVVSTYSQQVNWRIPH